MTTKSFLNGLFVGALAGSLAFATTARATPLNPGDLLNSPPVTFDTLSGSAGTLVNASSGLITTSSFTATIRQAVFNPGIANTLDYYFQVANSAGSSDAIGPGH